MSTVILAEKPSQALAYAQAFKQSEKVMKQKCMSWQYLKSTHI
nr:hypothetical protein [Enterococcus faecium]